MSRQQVTRTQAEAALAAIRTQFASSLSDDGQQPQLFEPGFQCSGWAIGWEEGPHEWTYAAFHGGFDDEMYGLAVEAGADREQARRLATIAGVPVPAGVFAEPVNHWCLGLYPA